MNSQFKKYSMEFLTIVLGISVSFWVENYRQERMLQKEERMVLLDLKDEIESNINYIQYQVARIDSQLNTITYYLDNYDNYSKDDYFENKLLVTVGWIPWTPSTHIYESLKSSGRIELINNESIKNKLGYLFSFEVERTTGWAAINRENMRDFQSRIETVYFSDYAFNENYFNSKTAHNLTYRDQWTSNWFYGKKNILKSQKLASNDFDIIQKEILILSNEELGT